VISLFAFLKPPILQTLPLDFFLKYMNKNSRYAFYGSLRKGMYNYLRFEKHLTFLYSEEISGFQLYALEQYPAAIKTNDSIDTIKVEVMRVTNPAVETQIHELELSVGYYYDEVMIRDEMIGIYLFHRKEGGSLKSSRPLVADGDWVQFLGKQA
jgi:gamma-glutamylcyclotransferase (GGCT)/AIG2-like uncharacterized protein YtfP